MYKDKKTKKTRKSTHREVYVCITPRACARGMNFFVCVRTSTCAYAQVNFQPSVRTHTSVRTHRSLHVMALMKHVSRNFLGILAHLERLECYFGVLHEGEFNTYQKKILGGTY
ncbi:uncharacterized protein DS421_14g462950 [Arachis hypogaea]|nr:uncharacterized protein DS421_14g462950 [Arachis hypogaea]